MLDGEQQLIEFIAMDMAAGQSVAIDRNTALLESGLVDSMGLFRLVSYIEERFEVRFPEEALLAENFQSVAMIADFIDRLRSNRVQEQ